MINLVGHTILYVERKDENSVNLLLTDNLTIVALMREEFYGSPRSSRWKTVRDKHIKENPDCVACGASKGLNAHHVRPYHLHPELELDPTNLVTLCESPAHNCHLIFGHLLNWSSFNAEVVEDSKAFFQKIKNRPM